MEHIEIYRDHKILAWTEEAKPGRWTWHYTIDDENLARSPEEAVGPEQQMLQQAIDAARSSIDAWPADLD